MASSSPVPNHPSSPDSSPARHRGFSLKSGHSYHTTSSNKHSHDGSGSHEDSPQHQHHSNLHTKADPLLAMSEAQPMSVALEKSNLGSLRSVQHKDQYGNAITEPDLSNPTRPRFERPLDTIRSFEAAIYGTNNKDRPLSFARTDDAGEYSRRGSYFGGNVNGYPTPRGYSEQNIYTRASQSRPDSFIDAYNYPAADNYYPYNSNRTRGSRRPRMTPEQAMYANGEYPQNGYSYPNYGNGNGNGNGTYQRSYENVTAGSGSNTTTTEPWNTSTDPSSVNSSIDQLQQQQYQQYQQQQRMEEKAAAEYGFSGFGSGPNLANANGGMPPPPPSHGTPYYGAAGGRTSKPLPTPYASGGGEPVDTAPGVAPSTRRHLRKATNGSDSSDKRKSWFKRKFSKG